MVTRVVFRVGDADARALESGFSFFEAKDIQNLEIGQAICRVERADGDFNLTVSLPDEIDAHTAEATRDAVIAASRRNMELHAPKWSRCCSQSSI